MRSSTWLPAPETSAEMQALVDSAQALHRRILEAETNGHLTSHLHPLDLWALHSTTASIHRAITTASTACVEGLRYP